MGKMREMFGTETKRARERSFLERDRFWGEMSGVECECVCVSVCESVCRLMLGAGL